jgi:hypothetical protein
MRGELRRARQHLDFQLPERGYAASVQGLCFYLEEEDGVAPCSSSSQSFGRIAYFCVGVCFTLQAG